MKPFRILIAVGVLALAVQASGQTLTNLYSFTGGIDGGIPLAGLVQGSDGNFYGTTGQGGDTNANGGQGYGTVFQISPSGILTNLHSFNGFPSDGRHPEAPLVQGTDGLFYGTTANGGASTNCGYGCGTVFKISSSGSLTTLYSFSGTDGQNPVGGLVEGTDGCFYGTAQLGGTLGAGTVFRINASGTLTTLWNFCSDWNGSTCLDGEEPLAGLVQGSDDNFYGTTDTQGGGTPYQVGTIFRISPSGTLTTLYAFGGEGDGGGPQAPLVQDTGGNFYGTTFNGGTNPLVAGTVFRIGPAGGLTNVCSFDLVDGGYPIGGLVLGSDGNFYGMTTQLGAFNHGTLYTVGLSGSLTNLQSFMGGTDGNGSSSSLVQGSDGSFYGTTRSGGIYTNGTVFRITVPLNPPANQISGFQPVGTNVVLTVRSVASETYQLQFATDLVAGNWSNVVGVCVSNSVGAALTVTNFGGVTGPQGFYRFAITP